MIQPRIQRKRESWLFVIAIEGTKTEDLYFEKFNCRKVKVDILPTLKGHSTPESVLERLRKYKSENDIGEDDECWLVVDVDDRSEEKLKKVFSDAIEEQFQIAISNPCFEFWLFLHRFKADELPMHIRQVEVVNRPKTMKHILDETKYSYRSIPYGDFLIDVDKAIQEAEKHRKYSRDIIPQFPSTDLYKVVKSLREKAAGS
jgi:hypothetical protein